MAARVVKLTVITDFVRTIYTVVCTTEISSGLRKLLHNPARTPKCYNLLQRQSQSSSLI